MTKPQKEGISVYRIVTKRILVLMLVFTLVLTAVGCSMLPEKMAIRKIERHLNRTYDSVFKVTMIDYDAHTFSYTAQVTELNSARFFTASYDFWGRISDDYASVAEGNALEQKIAAICEKYPQFRMEGLAIEWEDLITKNRRQTLLRYWTQMSQQDTSLENVDIGIQATLHTGHTQPAQLAGELFALLEEMRSENISIKFYVENDFGDYQCGTNISTKIHNSLESVQLQLHTLEIRAELYRMVCKRLEGYESFTVRDVRVFWPDRPESWTNETTVEEFIAANKESICVDLSAPVENPQGCADDIYGLCQSFQEDGLFVEFEVYYGDRDFAAARIDTTYDLKKIQDRLKWLE